MSFDFESLMLPVVQGSQEKQEESALQQKCLGTFTETHDFDSIAFCDLTFENQTVAVT